MKIKLNSIYPLNRFSYMYQKQHGKVLPMYQPNITYDKDSILLFDKSGYEYEYAFIKSLISPNTQMPNTNNIYTFKTAAIIDDIYKARPVIERSGDYDNVTILSCDDKKVYKGSGASWVEQYALDTTHTYIIKKTAEFYEYNGSNVIQIKENGTNASAIGAFRSDTYKWYYIK